MGVAEKWTTMKLSRRYRSSILWAVVIQLLTLGITSVTFDGHYDDILRCKHVLEQYKSCDLINNAKRYLQPIDSLEFEELHLQ